MILVDSSVWIDHFRDANPELAKVLSNEQVLIHPYIEGEIALGNLAGRGHVLALLRLLQPVKIASNEEVLDFVERHKLWGKGIGWVDAHVLASVKLTPGVTIWTRDKRLAELATTFGVAYPGKALQ